MKYQDRKDKFLCDSFQNEHLNYHRDDKDLREARRVWKKARNKYLRASGKRQAKKLEEE
jgi:hypothetical protein